MKIPNTLNNFFFRETIFLLLIFQLAFYQKIQCQQIINADTKITEKKDTLSEEQKIRLHSPKKATLYSMILPGLGQAYNKEYITIAAIYAGAGILTYAISFNQKNYKTFRDAYNLRSDGDTNTIDDYTFYSVDNLLLLRNYYRRNLELSYIFSAALYILNIIDAAVYAHLFYFDVSDDLSMRIEPIIHSASKNEYYTGLKLTINLK